MTRVIIKFKDGEHLNIPADYIDIRDGMVMAWNGEYIVALAKAEEVNSCYISEKKGGNT
jgi:hypothetical protein